MINVKNDEKIKRLITAIGLTIFSFILVIPFIKAGQLAVHSDWSFHSARVQQIYLNLKRGHWFTFIGTDTFQKVGNGNFLFYPSVFLYPWAILKLFLKPIEAYLVYVWLLFVATMLISYFCMISYSKGNNFKSIVFAIVYTIAPYHLYLTLRNYVLGESQAYVFLPLVLLGIYKLLYKNKYITLGVGMSLIAYCHYVSAFISVEVLIIIVAVYFLINRNNFQRILISLLKSVAIFVLLTAWQFVPLITDYLDKNLVKPTSQLTGMPSLANFVGNALSNQITNQGGVGLLLIITAFFGWIWIRKNSISNVIWQLGILFTLMVTTVFPHRFFENTPFSVIQFPYRYTGFAICFLSIICAEGLSSYYTDNFKFKNLKLFGILLMLMVLYAGSIVEIYNRNTNYDGNIKTLISSTKNYQTLYSDDVPIIINDQNYNNQFSYGALYGETDYFPMSAYEHQESIFNHFAYINTKKTKVYPLVKSNKLIYHLNIKRTANVDLPVLAFSKTTLKVNNKNKNYDISKRGTVQTNLNRGRYIVEVSYKMPIIYYVLLTTAVIVWLGLITSYFYSISNNLR